MSLPIPELAPAQHPLERLPEEWAEVLGGWGEPRYRGLQVFQWIHQRGVLDPDAMTNLPKTLRARLREEGLGLPLTVSHLHPSNDGTRKLLVRMLDGSEVETVLIPQLEKVDPDADGDSDESDEQGTATAAWVPGTVVTQCISSQVGCAMGCVFCASGVMGLKRHMTAAEIVSQVLLGRSLTTEREHLRNIVLMGMGEPLHNYDNVARALVLLTHPEGLALGKRRVTLSTSGLVPQIDRLAQDFDGQVQLAISLHAVTDERRSSIMPINRKHSLDDLMACLKRYPLPKRRRITIEYTLIRGVNDDLRDADALVKLLRGVPAKVNLIPMNPIADSALAAPREDGVTAFRERLFERGLSAFVRKTRGDDIAAACGQLAYHGDDGRRRRLPVA
ncbi:MAG: 23S rRNA (adenine(2503)-C(2))-methyltransferase RlmN [Myxococcales bacterium]|nr:23S rRNA (adenine(2503)-C(2))-methyltransferase RlmN [Myxococcales bacterium]MCB9626284.1 23S rRNA (adenine(2503)-C(2))-methyltransferase RlmN [Sandaracinaceae bacterium]